MTEKKHTPAPAPQPTRIDEQRHRVLDHDYGERKSNDVVTFHSPPPPPPSPPKTEK
ncbi:MAG: hypothetical protein Q7K57_23335 [Burkholderiaceae bacterium]|nr:hypothetical protein [Burkholderiaceae bacterium]